MSARKEMEKLRKQRREYIHQKKRRKKRQKRRLERERAEARALERERSERHRLEKQRLERQRLETWVEEEPEEAWAEGETRTEEEVRTEEEAWAEEETPTEEEVPTEEESRTEKETPTEEEPEETLPERPGRQGRQGKPKKKQHSGRPRQEVRRTQPRRQRRRRRSRKYQSRRYQRRRYQRRRWISDKLVKIAVLFLFLGVLYVYCRPKVVEELVVEAGTGVPEVSAFLMREFKDAHFTQEPETQIDMHTVGDYEIGIMISGTEYTSVLRVVDTIAPTAATKAVQIFKDNPLEPVDFIEQIDDATQTTVKFITTPDFAVPGEQKVELAVVDEGGNTTRVSAVMEILEDTEPPVIEGVEELTAAIGGSISYKKNVTVSDNYDDKVQLEIDNSQVDLNTQGDYPVTYIARDAAGNVTEEETVVHVAPEDVEIPGVERVNEKADEILQQITTSDMSQRDVAKAIFDWVHGNIGWSDNTPKTSWVEGAYRGLFERRGDCWVYASTSKCLLTQAGIKNMDIGFTSPQRSHYWNLIDLGEGWYHFDATRRADGSSFFYYHDADIRAYSDSHLWNGVGSHAYDPSQYPEIQ